MKSPHRELLAAIRSDDSATVARLIAGGCKVDFHDLIDDLATTPLHLAVGKNPAIAAALLAVGAKCNVADEGGFSPLMQAVAEKDYVSARALLAHGADIDFQDAPGRITALHAAVFATFRDGDFSRLRFMQELGADARLTMAWQGHAALTPRALAVVLQGESGDLVEALDNPLRPERRLIAGAREAFMQGMSGRAGNDKKRYGLK